MPWLMIFGIVPRDHRFPYFFRARSRTYEFFHLPTLCVNQQSMTRENLAIDFFPPSAPALQWLFYRGFFSDHGFPSLKW